MPRTMVVVLAAAAQAAPAHDTDDADPSTLWDEKSGFIGATTADVESGHMTLAEAKRRCASSSQCEAITHRNAELKADPGGTAFFYLKAGKQVSESDRTWTSFVKKPAGSPRHLQCACPIGATRGARAPLAQVCSTSTSTTRSTSRSSCAGLTSPARSRPSATARRRRAPRAT